MSDEPQRHRIQVACPECGHVQIEPALVVSTQCRSCRSHFEVRDGKGVVRTRPVTRLAKPRRDGDPEPATAPPVAARPPAFRPRPNSPPSKPLLLRLLGRNKPPREVHCFQCAHQFSAIAEAQSSQCPKCGSYVSLLDFSITEAWNRRIETRGNVIIQKTGTVTGTTIRCHHLTIIGELAANVDCSGNLTIRSHGRITGTVRCRQLRIEKGVRVEFLHPVEAASAFIDGQVRGQISCSGTVILEKRAQFHGLVRTTELIVKPGATHTGTVELPNAAR
jgi:cytoskeletal protein CcmA (bactofilin family)/Zn finger protein HypA/HybF involved in hydrogenase expression